MPKDRKKQEAAHRARHFAEFREQLAFERLQERNPQQWVAFQRAHKLVDIQGELEGGEFPDGACFLHATTVGNQHFRVKKITGIDLETYQITLEIYGDEDLEEGIVVLPLEQLEWWGFPARAVPTIHFEGFLGIAPMPGQGGGSGKAPRAGVANDPPTAAAPET